MTGVESPIAAATAAPRRRRWLERTLAIALGIVLGLAVIAGFVFLGSEGAIDAPRISGVDTGKPGLEAGSEPTAPATGAQPSRP